MGCENQLRRAHRRYTSGRFTTQTMQITPLQSPTPANCASRTTPTPLLPSRLRRRRRRCPCLCFVESLCQPRHPFSGRRQGKVEPIFENLVPSVLLSIVRDNAEQGFSPTALEDNLFSEGVVTCSSCSAVCSCQTRKKVALGRNAFRRMQIYAINSNPVVCHGVYLIPIQCVSARSGGF